MVDILKPRVGLISRSVSVEPGARSRATIVLFPAASRPRKRRRSCRSFNRCFLRIVYSPILTTWSVRRSLTPIPLFVGLDLHGRPACLDDNSGHGLKDGAVSDMRLQSVSSTILQAVLICSARPPPHQRRRTPTPKANQVFWPFLCSCDNTLRQWRQWLRLVRHVARQPRHRTTNGW